MQKSLNLTWVTDRSSDIAKNRKVVLIDKKLGISNLLLACFGNLSCQNNDGIFAKNKLKTGRNANKAKIFLTLANFCETKQTQQTLSQAVQKNFWNVQMNYSSRLKVN